MKLSLSSDGPGRPVASSPAMAGGRRSIYRAVELAGIFGGVPAALTLTGLVRPILLLLLVASAACLVSLLRSPDFDRRRLWNAAPVAEELRRSGPRFLIVAAVMTAAVALLDPGSLGAFPRRAPVLWLAVMLLYPLLSVYPQELVFRAFVFHRYRDLFRDSSALVWASAAAFAWVHILFGNWIAVLLTLPGGWLFADTYRRSRSLLAASIEHALYGCFIFTVGLGRYFYNGA